VFHDLYRSIVAERPTIQGVLFGDNLLVLLLLALGGAMLVGNLLAVVRPRPSEREGELSRAPTWRSLGMAAIGLVVCVWAVASLVKKG
jgi:hypothetical protein